MVTKTQTDTTHRIPDYLTEMQSRTMEAFTAFTQANQRVLQELVELSAAATQEGMRACAEIHSAAVEAIREVKPPPSVLRDTPVATLEEMQRDPLAWYQGHLQSTVDGTQKAFKLVETNAQIATRSAERLQATAERTGKQIQDALTSYMTRMKELYARN